MYNNSNNQLKHKTQEQYNTFYHWKIFKVRIVKLLVLHISSHRMPRPKVFEFVFILFPWHTKFEEVTSEKTLGLHSCIVGKDSILQGK